MKEKGEMRFFTPLYTLLISITIALCISAWGPQEWVLAYQYKMSILLWKFVDFLTLLERSCVPIFASFHKEYCDLQKYRPLQMLLTYDIMDVSLRHIINNMVLENFSVKRERIISLPVKFQLHIISRSTIFCVSKVGGTPPP